MELLNALKVRSLSTSRKMKTWTIAKRLHRIPRLVLRHISRNLKLKEISTRAHAKEVIVNLLLFLSVCHWAIY